MSAIKFRNRLTKFKITIALPKKFGSKVFITAVKINFKKALMPASLKFHILIPNQKIGDPNR